MQRIGQTRVSVAEPATLKKQVVVSLFPSKDEAADVLSPDIFAFLAKNYNEPLAYT